jgi:succinylarginine dihydrolase
MNAGRTVRQRIPACLRLMYALWSQRHELRKANPAVILCAALLS